MDETSQQSRLIRVKADLELEKDVFDLLNDTRVQANQSFDDGVATVIRLWAKKGLKDEDDSRNDRIDAYFSGARFAYGHRNKQDIFLISMFIAASYALGNGAMLVVLAPIFLSCYAIFFIGRIIYNKISAVKSV